MIFEVPFLSGVLECYDDYGDIPSNNITFVYSLEQHRTEWHTSIGRDLQTSIPTAQPLRG